MKNLLRSSQFILFGLFNLSLLATVLQLSGDVNPLSELDHARPVYNNQEEYDPSLGRISSVKKLIAHCDSIYYANVTEPAFNERKYTDIVSDVIRKRFFHGYSYYGFSDNYMGLLLSRVTVEGLGAVVIPDDVLKYDFAACSQQSIIMMEVLGTKGIRTKKIGFNGSTTGHFCLEVFYENGWHFYDPNMEPDTAILNSYNRPGIAFLAENTDVLFSAYKQWPREKILDLFPNYFYGEINKFPAPRAILFQKLTKVLSYFVWLFFLAAYLAVREKYRRLTRKHVWTNRIHLSSLQTGTATANYPGFAAPGT